MPDLVLDAGQGSQEMHAAGLMLPAAKWGGGFQLEKSCVNKCEIKSTSGQQGSTCKGPEEAAAEQSQSWKTARGTTARERLGETGGRRQGAAGVL